MPADLHLSRRVREVLAGQSGVVEKSMFGGLAFMVNGYMCCGVSGEDLVIRVGKEGHEEALARPHVRPMDFTGRPMKGFLYVSPAGYRTKAQLKNWIQRSLRFVLSLPPKP